MPVISLAPAATGSTQFQIEAASNFVWVKAAFIADIAGAAQTDATRIVPNVDVQLQTTGSDKNLFQNFVPIPSVFGDGRLPFVLPFPMVLTANSILRADFQSREAANTLNIRLAFIGWKDYGELNTGGA